MSSWVHFWSVSMEELCPQVGHQSRESAGLPSFMSLEVEPPCQALVLAMMSSSSNLFGPSPVICPFIKNTWTPGNRGRLFLWRRYLRKNKLRGAFLCYFSLPAVVGAVGEAVGKGRQGGHRCFGRAAGSPQLRWMKGGVYYCVEQDVHQPCRTERIDCLHGLPPLAALLR